MSLGHILDETARRTPEAAALICGNTRFSFAELSESTTGLAGWFLTQGLRPGDRVAIHWSNSIEIASLYFACFKAGLIAVPINQRLKAPEVAYMLAHAEASICFSQPELAPVARQAVEMNGGTIPILTELPGSRHEALPVVDATAPCAILYTSGTTARPKGVTHTQSSLLHAARLMLEMVGDAGPVALSTTPLTHTSGLMALLLPCVLLGWTHVLLPSFDPALTLDAIQAHSVTYSGGLPAMASMMVEEQIRRPRKTGSLRVFISGGDSVPLSLQQQVSSVFGLPVLELIGMTESCTVMWNTSDDVRAGSVGRPRNGVEVKLVPLIGDDSDA
jgi:long-chain acyl-CoA synthetase